jgi:hypothetical protein
MKVRLSAKPEITGYSSKLNMCGMSELIVHYEDGDASSDEISLYDVQLQDGTWMPLWQAFREKIVITDNYDSSFRQSLNDEERARGYYL